MSATLAKGILNSTKFLHELFYGQDGLVAAIESAKVLIFSVLFSLFSIMLYKSDITVQSTLISLFVMLYGAGCVEWLPAFPYKDWGAFLFSGSISIFGILTTPNFFYMFFVTCSLAIGLIRSDIKFFLMSRRSPAWLLVEFGALFIFEQYTPQVRFMVLMIICDFLLDLIPTDEAIRNMKTRYQEKSKQPVFGTSGTAGFSGNTSSGFSTPWSTYQNAFNYRPLQNPTNSAFGYTPATTAWNTASHVPAHPSHGPTEGWYTQEHLDDLIFKLTKGAKGLTLLRTSLLISAFMCLVCAGLGDVLTFTQIAHRGAWVCILVIKGIVYIDPYEILQTTSKLRSSKATVNTQQSFSSQSGTPNPFATGTKSTQESSRPSGFTTSQVPNPTPAPPQPAPPQPIFGAPSSGFKPSGSSWTQTPVAPPVAAQQPPWGQPASHQSSGWSSVKTDSWGSSSQSDGWGSASRPTSIWSKGSEQRSLSSMTPGGSWGNSSTHASPFQHQGTPFSGTNTSFGAPRNPFLAR